MRFPGEWETHERTIMGWPCRRELWGETFTQARRDYAAVANAIVEFEPVTMIANPGSDALDARALCSSRVNVVEFPLDDSWLRDSGPIYVVDDSEVGGRTAVHFGFNSWGEKFAPWDKDARIGELIARELGDEVRTATVDRVIDGESRTVPFVLEGGSVIADGEGTVLTTEQCLLNPNRNPGMSRYEIEAALAEYLGASEVLWLGQGLIEDRDTDGHVDLIAAFTGFGKALLQTVPDDNANFENCQENLRRLTDAAISVTEIPLLPYLNVGGEEIAASYLNLYICNGAVIVPVTGAREDEEALELIAGAFPGREIVDVPGAVIAYGGGGPHCITQQVPKV